MATLEALRRKIEATEDLHSVVRTMKALAAANIRQYEEATAAVRDYRRTVELGLRVVLRRAQPRHSGRQSSGTGGAAIVVGSDQGMCGQFNEDVARHATSMLRTLANHDGQEWQRLAVGEKLTTALESHGQKVTATQNVPSSAVAITERVRGLLAVIERWQVEHGPLSQVLLIYNQCEEHNTTPTDRRLLPMDEQWLQEIRSQPWATRVLPQFRTSADVLLSHLVRQYLFVELYGALAESLAAENATRLRAMQSAEKNVDQRLDEFTTRFNRQRQNSITAELLDVISGSEAVAS